MSKKMILEKGKYEVFFDGKKKIEIAKIRFMPDKKFRPTNQHLRGHKPKNKVLTVTKMNSRDFFEGKFKPVKK